MHVLGCDVSRDENHPSRRNAAWRLDGLSALVLLLRVVLPDARVHPLQTGDNVKVQYSGKLANGKVFDSGDISFPLGAGHVIKGVSSASGCALCHPFALVIHVSR